MPHAHSGQPARGVRSRTSPARTRKDVIRANDPTRGKKRGRLEPPSFSLQAAQPQLHSAILAEATLPPPRRCLQLDRRLARAVRPTRIARDPAVFVVRAVVIVGIARVATFGAVADALVALALVVVAAVRAAAVAPHQRRAGDRDISLRI